MKNQYFGDVKDYLTYGLLRTLSRVSGLRLGLAWMLTPNSDNRQGELRAYLRSPQQWRPPDPPLFDQLQQLLPTERRVAQLEAWGLLPGAAHFYEELPGPAAARAAYFERLWASLQGCPLLFFDPDNGLETPTTPRGANRSTQHLYWDELQAAYQCGHSLLVFQHFPRRGHAAYLAERAEQLAVHLGLPAVAWFEANQVAFFLLARPEHAAALAPAPAAVRAQWGQHLRPGQWSAPTAGPGLALSLLPEPLAVCRLEPGAPLPSWAGGPFTAFTRTPDELSVVCAEAGLPPAVRREGGWRALKVAGPLDFSLTGILAALAGPLAAAGVSLFAISTFDTDYILIKETALTQASAVLRAAGHTLHSP